MQDQPDLSEEMLRAENESIKRKLERQYGMIDFSTSLPPDLENTWLKSILAFEKTFQEEEREKLKRSLPEN